jgi:hypothetical protein
VVTSTVSTGNLEPDDVLEEGKDTFLEAEESEEARQEKLARLSSSNGFTGYMESDDEVEVEAHEHMLVVADETRIEIGEAFDEDIGLFLFQMSREQRQRKQVAFMFIDNFHAPKETSLWTGRGGIQQEIKTTLGLSSNTNLIPIFEEVM